MPEDTIITHQQLTSAYKEFYGSLKDRLAAQFTKASPFISSLLQQLNAKQGLTSKQLYELTNIYLSTRQGINKELDLKERNLMLSLLNFSIVVDMSDYGDWISGHSTVFIKNDARLNKKVEAYAYTIGLNPEISEDYSRSLKNLVASRFFLAKELLFYLSSFKRNNLLSFACFKKLTQISDFHHFTRFGGMLEMGYNSASLVERIFSDNKTGTLLLYGRLKESLGNQFSCENLETLLNSPGLVEQKATASPLWVAANMSDDLDDEKEGVPKISKIQNWLNEMARFVDPQKVYNSVVQPYIYCLYGHNDERSDAKRKAACDLLNALKEKSPQEQEYIILGADYIGYVTSLDNTRNVGEGRLKLYNIMLRSDAIQLQEFTKAWQALRGDRRIVFCDSFWATDYVFKHSYQSWEAAATTFRSLYDELNNYRRLDAVMRACLELPLGHPKITVLKNITTAFYDSCGRKKIAQEQVDSVINEILKCVQSNAVLDHVTNFSNSNMALAQLEDLIKQTIASERVFLAAAVTLGQAVRDNTLPAGQASLPGVLGGVNAGLGLKILSFLRPVSATPHHSGLRFFTYNKADMIESADAKSGCHFSHG